MDVSSPFPPLAEMLHREQPILKRNKAWCCFCFYYTKIKQGIRKQTAQAVISSVCAQTSTPADSRDRFNHQTDRSFDNKCFKLIWEKALYIQHLSNSLLGCFLASWQKQFKPPTSREAACFHTDTNLLACIPLSGHIIYSCPKCPSTIQHSLPTAENTAAAQCFSTLHLQEL